MKGDSANAHSAEVYSAKMFSANHPATQNYLFIWHTVSFVRLNTLQDFGKALSALLMIETSRGFLNNPYDCFMDFSSNSSK